MKALVEKRSRTHFLLMWILYSTPNWTLTLMDVIYSTLYDAQCFKWMPLLTLIPMSAVEILAGRLVDVLPPQHTLSGSLLLSSVLFLLPNQKILFPTGHLILHGFFIALVVPAVSRPVAEHFPKRDLNIIFAILHSSLTFCKMVTLILIIWTDFDWDVALAKYAYCLVFLSVVTFLTLKCTSHDVPDNITVWKHTWTETWSSLRVRKMAAVALCFKFIHKCILVLTLEYIIQSTVTSSLSVEIISVLYLSAGDFGALAVCLGSPKYNILISLWRVHFTIYPLIFILFFTANFFKEFTGCVLILISLSLSSVDMFLSGPLTVQMGKSPGEIVGIVHGFGIVGDILAVFFTQVFSLSVASIITFLFISMYSLFFTLLVSRYELSELPG